MPYAIGTLNKKLHSAIAFLDYLAARGHIPKSLAEVLQPVKMPRRLPLSVFQHEGIVKALEAIDTSNPLAYRDRTILELLYSTAIRVSELTGLDAGSIDLRGGSLKVLGKGSKERIVPVGKTALRFLETYVKAVRPFLLKHPDEKAVFLNSRGERISRNAVTIIVHRRCPVKAVGVNATSHTFRRSCATELIKSNANLYHVKEFMGHESLDTLKRYVNLSETEVKEMHSKCHPREKDEE